MPEMKLKLYDTLSRGEPKPISLAQPIRLYTCGPTVYDTAHIGNLRSYIFADLIRRVLIADGNEVRWVMNVTDVDDKTIKRAIDKSGPEADTAKLREYTEEYIQKFLNDLKEVNIPTSEPELRLIRVSDHIPEILDFVRELIRKGYAYIAEDGVYFSIQKYLEDFGDYGALVGPEFLAGKKVGARVKVDEYEKENLSDFALWKARDASDGNIFWKDPAGEIPDGRPGWHIECSVINRFAFGNVPTDIHTGGVDLIFPHHTNEIAQSQPLYRPFARYWAHCEHLLAGGRKMAKREGNFYTLEDLRAFPSKFWKNAEDLPDVGMAFRYLTLQSHYRSQMNFTKEALVAAFSGLKHLSKLRSEKPRSEMTPDQSYEKAFWEDLNNDLNTAGALDTLWQLVGHKGVDERADQMAATLGLRFFKPEIPEKIPEKIKELAEKREEARRSEQFIQADRLRDEINQLGYEVSDTPSGPAVRKKS